MKLLLYVACIICVCCCLWREATSCSDKNRYCSDWARKGECSRNPRYMNVNCQRSCNKCPRASNCYDYDRNCPYWARTGLCTRNPAYMGLYCKKSCRKCVVNGNWGAWGRWTTCSRTCGGGTMSRRRTCSNPAPRNGGRTCGGYSTETKSCIISPCKVPVNGNWGAWGRWTTCSKNCGGGTMSRSRTCSNPAPRNGGRTCAGYSTMTQNCNTSPCKVDGNWAAWGYWTTCSKTCGGGYMTRSRTCTNPAPRYGGRACQGSRSESTSCNMQQCPRPAVDGQWGLWSEWSPCSKTCGIGQETRARICDNPFPENGGKPCVGNSQERRQCSLKAECPAETCGRPKKSRIVGGEVASNRDWPWQIGLQTMDDDFIFCGGSLINREWVLTAAHCIFRNNPSRQGCVAPSPGLRIILGEFDVNNIEGHEVQKTVSKVCMHPNYDHSIFNNDIALLRFASPLPGFNETMSPVCLPTSESNFPTGTTCSVTGWGRTHQSGWVSNQLRVARVPIIDHANCTRQYLENTGDIVTDRMICAGYQQGQVDSCKGDSGGPFVCQEGGRFVLAGATSWGVGCAQAGRPGVYTDIKDFLTWIDCTMFPDKPECMQIP